MNFPEIRVGYVPELPLTTPCFDNTGYLKPTDTECSYFHGTGVEFINLLVTALNKTISIRYIKFITYAEMEQSLIRNEFDLTIPQMWITIERLNLSGFGTVLPNFDTYNTGFLVNPAAQLQIAPLFRGFSKTIWLAGAFSYLAVALLMHSIRKAKDFAPSFYGVIRFISDACFEMSFYQRIIKLWTVTVQTAVLILLYSSIARVIRTIYFICYLKSKAPFVEHNDGFNSIPKITMRVHNGYDLFLDNSVFLGLNASRGDPLRNALAETNQLRLVDHGDPNKLIARTMRTHMTIFWNSIDSLRYNVRRYDGSVFIVENTGQVNYLTSCLVSSKLKKIEHILNSRSLQLLEIGVKNKIFSKYSYSSRKISKKSENFVYSIRDSKTTYGVDDLTEVNLFVGLLYLASVLLFTIEFILNYSRNVG